jgi:hypothetical protein
MFFGYTERIREKRWCDGQFRAGLHYNEKHLALDDTITACGEDKCRFGYQCNKCHTILINVADVLLHKKLCPKFNREKDKITCLECGHVIEVQVYDEYYSYYQPHCNKIHERILEHLYKHDCQKMAKERCQMFMILCTKLDTDSARVIVQQACPKEEISEWKKKFV